MKILLIADGDGSGQPVQVPAALIIPPAAIPNVTDQAAPLQPPPAPQTDTEAERALETLRNENARLRLMIATASPFPETDAELRKLVADADPDELPWLYQAGKRLESIVNERWSKQA